MEDIKVAVRYSLGRTINLGNFESVRVDVALEARGVKGQAQKLYDQIKGFVDKRVEKEEERWRSG